VVEKIEVKQAILAPLSRIVANEAIIGTNTSSLSVTELSAACEKPERFLGLHFFNPPTKLELVEVVPTTQTSPVVVDEAAKLLRDCGKTPVTVKDSPGFIVNRLLLLMINEAARMVDQGVASAEDIDTAMRLGTNYPKGPLAWAKELGYQCIVGVLDHMQQEYREDRYRVAPLLRRWARLVQVAS
jgi:3-hydroxybutyryl-CoA dehydrogenase